MNISVPSDSTIELLDFKPVTPGVSKCIVKVLYVSDQPNRNGTVINKETALKMASTLPGCPIVGFYNDEKKDFEGHNREIGFTENANGNLELKLIDTTKAYGFIDMGAIPWFQSFKDADGVERLYLLVEGNVWTDIYPESKRIIEQGNNQSMELNHLSGENKKLWSNNDKEYKDFFIINDAVISKICVLGQDVEPCFEGAHIFSYSNLQNDIQRMMDELRTYSCRKVEDNNMDINQTTAQVAVENQAEVPVTPTTPEVVAPVAVPESAPVAVPETPVAPQPVAQEIPAPPTVSTEFADTSKEDEKKKKDEEDKDGKIYQLQTELATVKANYNKLYEQFTSLEADAKGLREFKMQADLKAKQEMIASFSCLSDADKIDVTTNINSYSLEQIESKLSIVFARNNRASDAPVSTAPAPNTAEEMVFNLNSVDGGTPHMSALGAALAKKQAEML